VFDLHSRVVAKTVSFATPSQTTLAVKGTRPRDATITLKGLIADLPGARSDGSSARTVPAPTIMASTPARIRFISLREELDVIHLDLPLMSLILPSIEVPSLSVT